MVRGLETFKEFFAPYAGQYVLIGGTAASLAMGEVGLSFRATKDLDIVLHVEATNAEFGSAFWRFVESAGYAIREAGSGRPVLYRFQKPSDERYPAMLELFSRTPDGLHLAPGSHLCPIPLSEDVSSLSAILLDEEYYRFVIDHRKAADGLSWIGAECLIPLKANAWLDLTARKQAGDGVDSKSITKHRNDVVRLSQLLAPDDQIELAAKIFDDLTRFLAELERGIQFDPQTLGVRTSLPDVLRRIRQAYVMAQSGK